MNASDRGRLLHRLADLIERDRYYLTVIFQYIVIYFHCRLNPFPFSNSPLMSKIVWHQTKGAVFAGLMNGLRKGVLNWCMLCMCMQIVTSCMMGACM